MVGTQKASTASMHQAMGQVLQVLGAQTMVPGSAAQASPGRLVEMHNPCFIEVFYKRCKVLESPAL